MQKTSCACCLSWIVFIEVDRVCLNFMDTAWYIAVRLSLPPTFDLTFFFAFFCHVVAFNMTKRDSQLAELSCPRVSLGRLPWCWHAHGSDHELYQPTTASTTTGTPRFQLPNTLQPGEYRQKNAHTTIFKIFEYGDGLAQLRVEEIDSNGYIRKKTLETYFLGINGHLRDSRGESMNTWELCQQLANYWSEWFGLSTQGAVFPAYESTNQAQDQAPASTWTSAQGPMTTQQVASTAHQIPTPILQLAWLLHSLIDQNPAQNSDLIHLLNSATPGSLAWWSERWKLGPEYPFQLERSRGHSFEHFGSKPRSESGNPNGSCGW